MHPEEPHKETRRELMKDIRLFLAIVAAGFIVSAGVDAIKRGPKAFFGDIEHAMVLVDKKLS